MGRDYGKQPSPEMMNAAREQQIVNARLAAMTAIAQIHQGLGTPVDQLRVEADKVVEYVIGDLDSLKPKSSIVLQTQMPPPGTFEPGKH